MSNIIKVLLSIIIFMQVTFFYAQNLNESKLEKNVPLIVLDMFNQKFPSQDPIWFSGYQGKYDQKLVFEAKFFFDNRTFMAIYDKSGNLLAIASTIEKHELPDRVNNYMSENYASFPIVEILLVTRGKDDITYEIGIYIDNQYVIQVFTKNGAFLKSTKA